MPIVIDLTRDDGFLQMCCSVLTFERSEPRPRSQALVGKRENWRMERVSREKIKSRECNEQEEVS